MPSAVISVAEADVGTLVDPRPARRRPRRRTTSLLLRLAVPTALVALWWAITATGLMQQAVLASPGQVFSALLELARSGQLLDYTLASARRAVLGVALGVLAGGIFGVAAGVNRLGEELIDSTMQINRAVPFLALAPLFIAWFGIDETYKVVLIAVATVAPMYAYTYLGVRGVDRKMIEAAREVGLRGPRLLLEVIIPAALPSVLMGLRVCLSLSILGLIAAEQVGTKQGIGYLVSEAQEYNRTDYMVLCVVLYAVLGLVFDFAVRLCERYAMPWNRGVRR